jgi:transposase
LPPTNNDLEQVFGAQRHHERRTTGRKVASPSLVVRGSVRVLAATLTRLAPISAQDLAAVDPVKWRETRARLKQRHHARVLRSRFRRNPAAYLAALEQRAFQQLALPP